MEWQGINLNGYRHQQWLTQSVKNLSYLTACLVISTLLALLIHWQNQQQQHQFHALAQQRQQSQEQQTALTQQIEQLTLQSQNKSTQSLENRQITAFLNYLLGIKLSGIIEIAQLYQAENTIFKLTGKVSSPAQFSQLEKQLKTMNYLYQIEQFETREKSEIEFSLHIDLKEKE